MVLAEAVAGERSPRVLVEGFRECSGGGTHVPGRRQSPMSETEVRGGAVDQTTELSEEVFASVESGQRAAIGAVRKFVDTVDEKLPSLGDEHPSRRQDIIDAALEMADQLVHTEYDFLRKVAHSAGKALGRPDDGK
jgi:hypothetical protein